MKPIGIIGGAGPLAGASLLERVLTCASKTYGCYRNTDFPKILLLSFPFTEMLTPDVDAEQVKNELKEALNEVRKSGACVIAIACNTLHAFLEEDPTDLIHLPKELARAIPKGELPLVLCTTTSVRYGLHRQYFPCIYPNPETQVEIDNIIDRVLMGADEEKIFQELMKILQNQTASTIVLGCTELSLFTKRLSSINKTIIDPLDIVASELLKTSFKGEK